MIVVLVSLSSHIHVITCTRKTAHKGALMVLELGLQSTECSVRTVEGLRFHLMYDVDSIFCFGIVL